MDRNPITATQPLAKTAPNSIESCAKRRVLKRPGPFPKTDPNQRRGASFSLNTHCSRGPSLSLLSCYVNPFGGGMAFQAMNHGLEARATSRPRQTKSRLPNNLRANDVVGILPLAGEFGSYIYDSSGDWDETPGPRLARHSIRPTPAAKTASARMNTGQGRPCSSIWPSST